MKITSPSDKKADRFSFEDVLKYFEDSFDVKSSLQTYFEIVICGEASKEVCKKIEDAYKGAGWKHASCSVYCNKRGYTNLILSMEPLSMIG